MYLGRSKRFTVQMQEYETYSFGANVSLSHHDLGYTDEEVAAMSPDDYADMRLRLIAAVNDELLVALDEDIQRTAQLTDNRHSFIKSAQYLVDTMDGAATITESQP